MINKHKKILKLLFVALIAFTSLRFSFSSIHAEENHDDQPADVITELGSAQNLFGNPRSREATSIGTRYARVSLSHDVDYVTHLYVGGKTVFCIEPMRLFDTNGNYSIDSVYWDELSEETRQSIWEIVYYGYNYDGHQTSRYYVATQLMIWQVVTGKWFTPYTPDGSSKLDVSAQVDEINRLRSQPQGRPSFHNQTVNLGLNTPVTITDTKGTLSNYSITSGKGISITQDGNNLTVEITSEDYDGTVTFNRKAPSKSDVFIIYGSTNYQRVLYEAKRSDPTPSFRLNFNLLYADIEITKNDIETGNTPQGDATFDKAEFVIKDLSGNVLETLTTSNQIVKSSRYPVGTSVQVCELTPPTGYTKNETCNIINFVFDGDNTKLAYDTTISNRVIKGQIEIAKSVDTFKLFGSYVQAPGKDFTFDIYLKSTDEKVATIATDEDGRAITPLLPYGTYIVKEQSKTSFDTLEPFEVFISEDSKVYFYNIYNDTLKAELTIYKIDKETGNVIPAAGVEFKIKDSSGGYITQTVTYPTKYTTDVFMTNEEGYVHLPEMLIFGDYSIVEISAPYGYYLSGTELPFSVDGSTIEIFIDFENNPVKGKVQIEKYGEQFTGVTTEETEYGIQYIPTYGQKYLDSVTFQIVAREDIVGQEGTVHYLKGEVVDEFTTTGNQITVSKKIPLGAYTIQEIDTKVGYVLVETVHEFDIEYDGQLVKVVFEKMVLTNDRQKLELDFTKRFEDNDPLAYKDVVFGVYSKNDILIDEEVVIPADSLVGTILLDEHGKPANQLDVPIGDYYIKELKTNVGFVLDENSYDFSFEYTSTDKKTSIIKIEDIMNFKRRIDIEIIKVDSNNKDVLLSKAVFEVTDKTTNEFLGIICTGRLAIRDSKPDIAYEISTVEDFSTILLTATTDKESEIILEVPTGTYYARKVESEDVTRIVVTDGTATLTDAVYGHEYEFKEIQAPTSYHLNRTPLIITCVAEEGVEKITFTFKNERIKVPYTGIEE